MDAYPLGVPGCSECGQENPEGFRYCGDCGVELTQALPPRAEVRKTVTVVFSDITALPLLASGSTPSHTSSLVTPRRSTFPPGGGRRMGA
jgi:hypothetical protein